MNDENRYIHDAYMSMAERTIRRLWIIILVLLAVLVGSFALFIYRESQYQIIEQEVVQENDGNGDNSFIGGDNNGTQTDNKDSKEN